MSTLTETEKVDEKLSFQKIFLVLKFNETPDDLLLAGMKLMGDSEQTRSYFKKLARMVHPDKNGHTLANTVFQKLSNATEQALTSFSQRGYDFFMEETRRDQARHFYSASGYGGYNQYASTI